MVPSCRYLFWDVVVGGGVVGAGCEIAKLRLRDFDVAPADDTVTEPVLVPVLRPLAAVTTRTQSEAPVPLAVDPQGPPEEVERVTQDWFTVAVQVPTFETDTLVDCAGGFEPPEVALNDNVDGDTVSVGGGGVTGVELLELELEVVEPEPEEGVEGVVGPVPWLQEIE